MCGIAGIVDFDGRDIPKALVQSMCTAICHRGPDDEGVLQIPEAPSSSEPRAVLGNRRLSIIDIAGGHQPIGNEDGSIWTVQNGEIYNFQELRERLEAKGHRFSTRSDTEIIVHLYEEMGDAVRARARRHVRDRAVGRSQEDAGAGARSLRQEAAAVCRGRGPLVVWIRVPGLARRSGDQARDRLRSARRVHVVHVGAGAADDLPADPQAAAGARAGPRRSRARASSATGRSSTRRRPTSAKTKRPRKCAGS